METEKNRLEEKTGEMHKRREMMADERRYVIFYTFGDEAEKPTGEVKENV